MTPTLNRRVTLEAATRVPDGAGGFVETWQALGSLWVGIKSGRGRIRDRFGVEMTSAPYKITTRAAPFQSPSRPVAGQRMKDGARVFRLLSVADADGAGRYLTCVAQEEEVSS